MSKLDDSEIRSVISLVCCPTCKSLKGFKCTKRLITGKVCRWDRRVKVDYVHAKRIKAAQQLL